MDFSKINIPDEVADILEVSYKIMFNTAFKILKDKEEFSMLNNYEYFNLILHNIKERGNLKFELESDRDDLDSNNSITLTFNDEEVESINSSTETKVIKKQVKKINKKEVSSKSNENEISSESNEKEVSSKSNENEISSKSNKKIDASSKSNDASSKSNENGKSEGKRGRPKMGKTIWKDVIIKSDQEWEEANSFIKNFIDELEDKLDNDSIESYREEQVELLKNYELNIISKIYRMVESSDYIELLKTLYKKNENVLNDLQNDNNYIKSIIEILDQEIKTEENNTELESLIKQNIPSELELVK
jgi:hypothetical protein